MSIPVALGAGRRLTALELVLGTMSVMRARRLVRARPVADLADRLDRILGARARAATLGQAVRADEVVCAVSPRYRSGRVPLERATAAALLCAQQGVRVRWCWGARTPPPETTAWIEAESGAVGGTYRVREAFDALLVVPAEPADV